MILVHCVVEKLKMKKKTYLDRYENKTIIGQYQFSCLEEGTYLVLLQEVVVGVAFQCMVKPQ